MSNYLRKKYNQEFVVEEPSLSAASLGVEGTRGADAHPVNNKDTTFRIIKADFLTSILQKSGLSARQLV